ncbi:hypothetical protein EVAR_80685_1 [Eumeta japonica]|uniref:Uncharacterized protein n=1 Tax=Eumeta variegata TaxID=151549 RepID=A0A4C1U4V5_EUMVA|nr:hypothetical protein EVAR_80685_1 [Eumeta japonica]
MKPKVFSYAHSVPNRASPPYTARRRARLPADVAESCEIIRGIIEDRGRDAKRALTGQTLTGDWRRPGRRAGRCTARGVCLAGGARGRNKFQNGRSKMQLFLSHSAQFGSPRVDPNEFTQQCDASERDRSVIYRQRKMCMRWTQVILAHAGHGLKNLSRMQH